MLVLAGSPGLFCPFFMFGQLCVAFGVGAAGLADAGVCDGQAIMTRRIGDADVSLCAPCAVAQGVAEMTF